jgi:hypothetical protein
MLDSLNIDGKIDGHGFTPVVKERAMKKEIGLWIDHYKTVMVSIDDEKEETREIHSNIEKHVRHSGGLHTKDPGTSPGSSAEDMSDRRFINHLNGYYDAVASLMRGAASILIFGPGSAKIELEKRLEREKLDGLIVSVETADKMTDRQIVAKVRGRFS